MDSERSILVMNCLAMKEVNNMDQLVDVVTLQPVYKKLWELVGEKAMLNIFEYYRGGQILAPLHLYNREIAKEQIIKRYDGTNQAELVRFYGYSERWTSNVLRKFGDFGNIQKR